MVRDAQGNFIKTALATISPYPRPGSSLPATWAMETHLKIFWNEGYGVLPSL
jgi:hypothetical protein